MLCKTVGQFDHDHAQVFRHRHKDFAQIGGVLRHIGLLFTPRAHRLAELFLSVVFVGLRVLFFAFVHARNLQFGHAVYEVRHFRPEFLRQLLRRDLAILHDIMEQTGGKRLLVHFQVGEDFGNFYGVNDVGFAAGAFLRGMGGMGEGIGAAYQVHVGLGAVGQQTRRDALHCGAEGLLKRALGILSRLFGGHPFRRGTNSKLCHDSVAPLQRGTVT